MVTTRRLPEERRLPDGFVAGEVRGDTDRHWVDVLPGAFVRLGVQVGDRVMVSAAEGDLYPGTVAHDGERLAIRCDEIIKHERVRVLVRRRRK